MSLVSRQHMLWAWTAEGCLLPGRMLPEKNPQRVKPRTILRHAAGLKALP